MAIPKFLKVGGPAITGIGGVFATSSLVSKSAEEKPEEKLKTKTLQDKDPLIDEWKDQNESDQQSQDQKEEKQEDSSSDSSEASDNQNSSSSESQSEEAKGEVKEQNSSESQGQQGDGEQSKADIAPPSGDSDTEGNEDGEEELGLETPPSGDEDASNGEDNGENGGGITDDGTSAENNHANGTAWGTKDVAMTEQDVANARQVKGKLEDVLSELKVLVSKV